MIIDVYNPYEHKEATEFHVNIIIECFQSLGYQIRKIESIKKRYANKNKGIIVIAPKDVIRAKVCGYKFIVLRNGGISPEESFMRHKSRLRYMVLSSIEWLGLQFADFSVFVSGAMLKHYERKYRIKFANYYIMPCFNEEIDEASFNISGRYKDNVFIYAGSLSTWQCFEKTVEVYKYIEERVSNTFFRVLVKETEEAREILKSFHIKNYSVDYVPVNKLNEEMKKAKFGFCLRENVKVNRVATPTKLSNYIANGVIPIYSKYLVDFKKIADSSRYCISFDNENTSMDMIVALCNKEITGENVLKDFKEHFGLYYSKEFHLRRLERLVSPMMKEVNCR